MLNKPIYLTGFMGSGKTTLGKLLARELNATFTDLDHLIESREKTTISELFAKQGEEGFRQLERQVIRETAGMQNTVIATGGGAPCFFDNMEIMNQNGTTIYLYLSPEALTQRLLPARNHRPLIAGKSEEELYNFIQTKLKEREPFYRKASIIADTGRLTPAETVRIVLQAMQIQ